MRRRERRRYGTRMPVSPKNLDPSYRHSPKEARPGEALALEGARLKWYDLHRAERPVPAEIRRLARDHLQAEDRAGRLGLEGDLGFVVLHLCGDSFYFLIVSTWRGSNELWETVYYKQDDAMPGFAIFPREGQHKPTYCVWELGPVLHEKQAWVRFLSSARDLPAEQAYLADQCSGPV